MKKILIMVFSVMVLASLGGWAQTSPQKSDKSSAKTMTIAGTVSSDGKMVVADKENKSWKVDNPETLKAHEGHHVSVTAEEDPSTETLHVQSVKMLGKGKSGAPSDSGGDNSGNKGSKY